MKVYTYKRTYKYGDKEHTHESKLYHTAGGIKQVLRDTYYDKDITKVQEYDLVLNRELDRATFLSEKGNPATTYLLQTHNVSDLYTGSLIKAKEHFASVHGVEIDSIMVETLSVIRV